jgi:hypothetical protein
MHTIITRSVACCWRFTRRKSKDQMPIEAQAKVLCGSSADVTEHKTWQEFVRNTPVSAAFRTRSTILVLMLVAGLVYQSALRARADENENKRAVKIMTQNVDAGTDFGYLTGVSGPAAFAQGVFFTYLEINASNIVPRVAQLAAKSPSIIQPWSAFKRSLCGVQGRSICPQHQHRRPRCLPCTINWSCFSMT